MKKGFSLVELSIVLVILGLLVGGILAGQSLIRASELRAVGTESQRYITALHAFRDKYFAQPGDMGNATSFWGKDATYCNGDTGTANAATGTCNGNSNSAMNYTNTAGPITQEHLQAWRQLALSGLIEGTYTGIKATIFADMGINAPASKFPRGVWTMYSFSSTGTTSNYQYDWGNQLQIYELNSGGSAGIFKPEEAWNIDKKLDDGKPGTGHIMAGYRDVCDTSTTFNDYSGEYDFAVTTPVCALRWSRVVQ